MLIAASKIIKTKKPSKQKEMVETSMKCINTSERMEEELALKI